VTNFSGERVGNAAKVLSWTAPAGASAARPGPRMKRRAAKYLEGGEWRAHGATWDWLVTNPLRHTDFFHHNNSTLIDFRVLVPSTFEFLEFLNNLWGLGTEWE
jgi:hypothetical protein